MLRFRLRFEEAEQAYDKAIGLIDREGASHWHLYFARGITRERQGNWIMAEVDLQKARQLSGDEPHVLNYLGYSWVDQGIYLKEGLAIIELAVRKEPSNGFSSTVWAGRITGWASMKRRWDISTRLAAGAHRSGDYRAFGRCAVASGA